MGDHSGQLRQLICALTRISEAAGAEASAHEQLVTRSWPGSWHSRSGAPAGLVGWGSGVGTARGKERGLGLGWPLLLQKCHFITRLSPLLTGGSGTGHLT